MKRKFNFGKDGGWLRTEVDLEREEISSVAKMGRNHLQSYKHYHERVVIEASIILLM